MDLISIQVYFLILKVFGKWFFPDKQYKFSVKASQFGNEFLESVATFLEILEYTVACGGR